MKNLERELNWLYDLAYNVVNPANKEDTDNAYKTIKESLERLEKLENIIDILKDEAYIIIETDIDETGTEFHATLREKGGNGEIFIDEVTREECYLLEEVFGEWKNT